MDINRKPSRDEAEELRDDAEARAKTGVTTESLKGVGAPAAPKRGEDAFDAPGTPLDPDRVGDAETEARIQVAGQWRLMWWKFK